MAALDAGCQLHDVQLAARHADPAPSPPPTTDDAGNAAYAVVTIVTNG